MFVVRMVTMFMVVIWNRKHDSHLSYLKETFTDPPRHTFQCPVGLQRLLQVPKSLQKYHKQEGGVQVQCRWYKLGGNMLETMCQFRFSVNCN